MSGKHTQGRIECYSPTYTSLVFLKISAEEGKVGLAYDEANARRLAACWNACANLPTEDIEELTEAGGVLPLVVFYEDTKQELAAARALLQEVCKECELWEAGIGYTASVSADCEKLVDRIRSFLEPQ